MNELYLEMNTHTLMLENKKERERDRENTNANTFTHTDGNAIPHTYIQSIDFVWD